jgi:NAD(P)-dependent dehydrogenase (short-subunit alcohol dehydrogenase family)
VQHILVLSRSAVTIRHWFEINLDDASTEHGARVEIRELPHQPHRGSESASQLTIVDRPLWRADLFDRLADPPGSFSAAHYHPQFTGNEPSARFWDAALTADPWIWLGEQITSLGTAAGGAAWPLDPEDAAELPGLASAVVATAQQFGPARCGVLPAGQGRPGLGAAHDRYAACAGASRPGPGGALAARRRLGLTLVARYQHPALIPTLDGSGPVDIADFSLDLFSLAGRNALVTGGNSGLGRAFSAALAKAGADVFAVGLAEDDGTTRQLIEAAGRRMEFMAADITQPGIPGAIVRRCVETLGSVDILVNCAGIALLAEVEAFGRDQWDPMVAVNLTAAFEVAHEASRFMIEQGWGKIINIASLFSFLGGQQSPAYAATKAGIVGFTKAYCDELAASNIQVNAIAPGYFKTAITEATRADPATDHRIVEHIPAARWGETGDLMGAAVFLASRAADYVNGHVLVVDGGYLVR